MVSVINGWLSKRSTMELQQDRISNDSAAGQCARVALKDAAVYLELDPMILKLAVKAHLITGSSDNRNEIFFEVDVIEQLKDSKRNLLEELAELGIVQIMKDPEGSRKLHRASLMPDKPYAFLYDKDIKADDANHFVCLFNAAIARISQKTQITLFAHLDDSCKVTLLSKHCGGFKFAGGDCLFAYSSEGHSFYFVNEILKVLSDETFLGKRMLSPSEPYPAELIIAHELGHACRHAFGLREETIKAEEKAVDRLVKGWYGDMAFYRYQQALRLFDNELVAIINKTYTPS